MVTGQPVHLAEDGLEVAALHRQELRERALAAGEVGRQDHLADGVDALGVEEHVLGAAETDALGAELRAPPRRRSACRRWCAP